MPTARRVSTSLGEAPDSHTVTFDTATTADTAITPRAAEDFTACDDTHTLTDGALRPRYGTQLWH